MPITDPSHYPDEGAMQPMMCVSPTFHTATYEPCQVYGLPFVFEGWDQAKAYFKSEDGKKDFIQPILEKAGIRMIECSFTGGRNLTTKNKKVLTPADANGLQIRCMDAPVWRNVVRALGGSPVVVAYNELYLALQTNVCDGQENPIGNIYDMKFYEVQKYIMQTEHVLNLAFFSISDIVWQKLTEEDQKILADALAAGAADQTASAMAQEDAYLDEMVASGCFS